MNLISFDKKELKSFDFSSSKEFLEANSVGCYSSSSVNFCNTRKYHGLLVPRQDQLGTDNYVLLSALDEVLKYEDKEVYLGTHEYPGTVSPKGYEWLKHFELKRIPTWVFGDSNFELKKELLLVEGKNQLMIRYTLLKGKKISLKLDPFTAYRRIHDLGKKREFEGAVSNIDNGIGYKMDNDYSSLHIQASCPVKFEENKLWFYNSQYRIEQDRGYDFQEDLYRVGQLSFEMKEGESVVISASTEEEKSVDFNDVFSSEFSDKKEIKSMDAALERAAKQFISKTNRGTEVCAGFHWFGRWGRDTFIALPGLTIARGKSKLCEEIIDTMLMDIEGGLLTNIGVGDVKEYNSVDASLWFFWTLCELAEKKKNKKHIWKKYGSKMKEILTAYKEGTMYNIHMQENGLLFSGAEGVALTWMDAKVDCEPVTPRRGCAVEINALWYNAIAFSIDCAKEGGDGTFAKHWSSIKKTIKANFIPEFWDKEKGYLADVVNGGQKDWSFRPNQLFSISLPYSLVNKRTGKSILSKAKKLLFCYQGIRTLSADDKAYVSQYKGDQKERDRTYHQGILWPWLLGTYCESNLKVNGSGFIKEIKKINDTFAMELSNDGLGSISELHNSSGDFEGVGTISQAWSVSELLRINKLVKKYK